MSESRILSGEPSNERLSRVGDLRNRFEPVISPAVSRQSGEKHEIERIRFAIRTPAKVVPKQEYGLLPGNGHPEFDHDTLVRRATIDDGEDTVGILDTIQIRLADIICPTVTSEIHLTDPLERFPNLGPDIFQGGLDFAKRP